MPETWKGDPIPAEESDVSSNLISSVSSVDGLSHRNRHSGEHFE